MTEEETRSFLGRAPRDVVTTVPSFLVNVVAGPDRGVAFALDGKEASRTLVGVSPACALRLRDPLVSRRHAALDVVPEGLHLQDLGSKNGTVVNGLRVADALLAGGEVIRLGSTMLKIERLADVEGRATSAMAFGRVIGASPEMRRLYPLCQVLARSSDPVVLEGEIGSGKELLAEALHEAGPRASGPFVVLDCATSRGRATLRAAFEQALGGTLLVDEAGELEADAQSFLLSALVHVDVRVLVASRRDLDAEVQAGRFREDLFRALSAGRIELPPLRKRKGDVALLARHFWRRMGGGDGIPADLVARLEAYAWPGNVRELANVVASRFASGDAEGLAADSFGDATLRDVMEQILDSDMPFSKARTAAMAEFERRYVARVLVRYGGHVGRAAAASGIARRYFQVIRGRSAR